MPGLAMWSSNEAHLGAAPHQLERAGELGMVDADVEGEIEARQGF